MDSKLANCKQTNSSQIVLAPMLATNHPGFILKIVYTLQRVDRGHQAILEAQNDVTVIGVHITHMLTH